MGREAAVEVAKTVLEVADVAWKAVELRHHHHHNHNHHETPPLPSPEINSLRAENQRLRNQLQQNLKLLQTLSSATQSPSLPPDMHEKLIASVESDRFLNRLEALSTENNCFDFPFKEPSGADLEAVEILINVGKEEPSWWVWVTDDMASRNIEEKSGIDNESYIVVSEEHIVEGVANFMAMCILSCPKTKDMSPHELQKTISKALGGMDKVEKMLNIWHAGTMFYTLSTWGLALAGLYRSRAILKVAAMGVHSTSKVVLRAL